MAYQNPFAPASAPQSGGSPAGYSNPFSTSAKQPIKSTPSSNINPAANNNGMLPALQTGTLGGGYSPSGIKDSSGKSLLMYENPALMASQLLPTRTAPTFDPTVPQKIDPSILQNGRMPEDVSQAIKANFPGSAAMELDHIMPLELGGSNDKSNLRFEGGKNNLIGYNAGSNPTPTDSLENALAQKVQKGQISLVDAWAQMAKAKGIVLPEEGGMNLPVGDTSQLYTPTSQLREETGKAISSAVSSAVGFVSSPNKVANELGEQSLMHPIQMIKNIADKAWSDAQGTFDNFTQSAASVVTDMQAVQNKNPRSVAQNLGDWMNLLTSAAGFTFLPVSETFNIMSQLPVIKPVGDAIGLIFNGAGKITGFAADQALDILPIPQSAKDTLREPITSIATLAGQITLGAYIYGKIADTMAGKPQGNILTDAEVKTIADDAKMKAEELNKEPIPTKPETPKTLEQEIIKSQEGKTVDLSKQGKPIEDIQAPEKPVSMQDEVIKKLTTPEEKPKFTDVLPPETKVSVGGKGDYKITSDNGGKNVMVVDRTTGNEEEVPRESVSQIKTPSEEIVPTTKVSRAQLPVGK